MYIEEQLSKIRKIIDCFDQNTALTVEQNLEMLIELEQLIGENPLLMKYQGISLYNAGYADEVKEYLLEGIKKFQRSYMLHELLFEITRYTDDKKRAFYALSQMFKLADNEEKRDEVLALVEDVVIESKMSMEEFGKLYELFKKESITQDYRFFPFDEYGSSVIRMDAFPGRDENYNYIVNMHRAVKTMEITSENRFFHLYETIRGAFVENGNVKISSKDGDVIAVSSAVKQATYTKLTIDNLEREPCRLILEPNLIRYYKIKEAKDITINADKDIFVSHFKKTVMNDKPRLVMQIFIDGLSYRFVKDNNLEELMPNTFEFFKSGYINNNCHANGEWTLPSLMSMCTGKYTTNHYVFHTEAPHKGEQLNTFIQEHFEKAGYMTGRICPNWRGTPSYGYFKGTNRSIYSPMGDRMNCDEVVTGTVEHIEAFKDFHNYVWMTIEDLHAVADGLARGAMHDVEIQKYYGENVKDDSEISVFRTYNPKKIEEYKAMIKKVDFYLGIVFDYIRKNYRQDEYVITINSDHGQRFIEEDDFMFAQRRTNVPFMMQGYGVVNKVSEEIMSNVDIYPTLLKVCGLSYNENSIDGRLLKDFGGEERDYAITESIFPGQTYKLAMNDKEHLFVLETKENTRSDGSIPISDYVVKLLNLATGEDETELYYEKVDECCKTAFKHIRHWIEV